MELTYLGNKELLNLPNIEFWASSTIPPDMVLKSYDGAQRMCRENQCVISGFCSHLEKQVLHFLLKGTQPIILVLARKPFRKMPTELKPLLDNGLLLIISTSSAVKQSKVTALQRNRFICEQANNILFVGVSNSSSLSDLQIEFADKSITVGNIFYRKSFRGGQTQYLDRNPQQAFGVFDGNKIIQQYFSNI